jgi:hypothetical protein
VRNYRVVEAGTDRPSPSWEEGLFAGSSPVVDINNRCVGQVKCAVGSGVGTLHTGGRCEAIVLFLFLTVSFTRL